MNENSYDLRPGELNSKMVKEVELSDDLRHQVKMNDSNINDQIHMPKIEEYKENNTSELENTLDEPIIESIKREFKRILNKLYTTIIPTFSVEKNSDLKNWDLWGPLILTLTLCM